MNDFSKLIINIFKKPSFAVLVLIVLTLYICLVISHRNIYDADVLFNVSERFIWLYRVLVNNGLAFYATWVTIATMLNFAIALTYDSGGKVNLRNINKILYLFFEI